MAWLLLFLAGLFEIVWAVGLRLSDGFTRALPLAVTLVAMVVSLGFLGLAIRTLPLGTAYAVWTGIGAIGTAAIGIVFFGEAASAARLLCLALIVAGILGLKLLGPDA